MTTRLLRSISAAYAVVLLAASSSLARDPLPSWNDGPTKQGIIRFVEETTKMGAPGYLPPEERIATFDNDGTLWCEEPVAFQFFFTIDRVKALAPEHPEWNETQPYKAILEGDMKTVLAVGEKGILEVMIATHAGMTSEEFTQIVKDWFATARHPKLGRPYTDLAYQPMLELLAYLREKGFRTYVVTGGGTEFVRAYAEKTYGIPPEQVIGSSIVTKYELRDGKPVLVRLPKMDFLDVNEGKPVAIQKFIGIRPAAAFGNSDLDIQMLQWTIAGPRERLAVLVHHTDADREFAYDRGAEKALAEAAKGGWSVVDMKKDWKVVYAFQKQ